MQLKARLLRSRNYRGAVFAGHARAPAKAPAHGAMFVGGVWVFRPSRRSKGFDSAVSSLRPRGRLLHIDVEPSLRRVYEPGTTPSGLPDSLPSKWSAVVGWGLRRCGLGKKIRRSLPRRPKKSLARNKLGRTWQGLRYWSKG